MGSFPFPDSLILLKTELIEINMKTPYKNDLKLTSNWNIWIKTNKKVSIIAFSNPAFSDLPTKKQMPNTIRKYINIFKFEKLINFFKGVINLWKS